MRRWVLSKKDKKKLIEKIKSMYNVELINRDDRVEVVVDDDTTMYLVNGVPTLVEVEGKVLPHLKFLIRNGYKWLPAIVVDQGAVIPISRGADLMRPGIVRIIGGFRRGEVVVIVEPTRLLPLAVHEALYDSKEVEAMDRGKVTRALHYLRDRFWRLAEEL